MQDLTPFMLRFGMFIHWGLYAIPAGEWEGRPVRGVGEWIMDRGQIPIEEYEPLKEQFNPVMFDADRWARIAKEAGMKYIVITTKHHDGFSLFDSKYTDYDIMATPFKRDIMKELSNACRRHGLKMCWYHSILDWHHPDYLPRRRWEIRTTEGADYNRYIDHMKNQLTELLTNYGEIGAFLDRLTHKCHILEDNGESYRLRKAKLSTMNKNNSKTK